MLKTSFAILLESRNFRGIKTKGIDKANNELTLHEIHHNVKKFEKHTTNKFLKRILNIIKKHKDDDENDNFSRIEKLSEKLNIKDNVIRDIRDD